LPVVVYGCEAWYVTLRKNYRLRMFENRVLRNILPLKRDKARGTWSKLQNEEIENV
jgi:hypothetical protein